jgi:hypothetical protein
LPGQEDAVGETFAANHPHPHVARRHA